jgi:hypothetical protein
MHTVRTEKLRTTTHTHTYSTLWLSFAQSLSYSLIERQKLDWNLFSPYLFLPFTRLLHQEKIRNKQKRKHISKIAPPHTEVALCTQQYHTIQFRSTIIELIVSREIQGATRPPARQHRHRLTTPIIAHTLCQQPSYP